MNRDKRLAFVVEKFDTTIGPKLDTRISELEKIFTGLRSVSSAAEKMVIFGFLVEQLGEDLFVSVGLEAGLALLVLEEGGSSEAVIERMVGVAKRVGFTDFDPQVLERVEQA